MDLRSGYLTDSTIREVLCRAVALRSISGEEAGLAAYIQRCLVQAGIEAQIDRHGNVIAQWDAGPGPTLVLNSHMDTVPPDGAWTLDPFVPQLRNGRVYGLGAADAKGSLAAMVCAVCALRDSGVSLSGRVIFTAVVAEEIPDVDAKGTVRAIRDGIRGDFGICGEPTELAVGLGCEGTLEVEVRTYGRSAHACDPGKGIHAIEHMIRFLSHVVRLPVAEHPLFGRGSINVGRIEGGVKGTMVPAGCRVRIGRFVLPGETMEQFVGELREIASRLHGEDPQVSVVIDPIYASSAAVIDQAHPVVDALTRAARQELGHPPILRGVKYHADSDFMANLGGIPTVIFGPGSIDQGHAPDEFVDLDQVIGSARVYARAIAEALGPRTGASIPGGKKP